MIYHRTIILLPTLPVPPSSALPKSNSESNNPIVVTGRMAAGPLPPGGIAIIVVNTVFLFLAIVAVIARFYSRYLQRKGPSTDDYLIVASLVSLPVTLLNYPNDGLHN